MYAPIALVALVAVCGVAASPAKTTPTVSALPPTSTLPAVEWGQQNCFGDSGVSNPFVDKDYQKHQSGEACLITRPSPMVDDTEPPIIKPDSPSVLFDLDGVRKELLEGLGEPGFAVMMKSTDDDHFYYYNFHWISGCDTVSEQNAFWSRSTNGTQLSCMDFLANDYQNCNNGGRGGWIDIGCLRYSFQTYNMTDGPESGGKF